MAEKIEIPDEEWAKFLKDEYSNVVYCLPEKSSTEKYLNWKQKQKEGGNTE